MRWTGSDATVGRFNIADEITDIASKQMVRYHVCMITVDEKHRTVAYNGSEWEFTAEKNCCVVTKDDIRPEFITSLYESAIVFGTVRQIKDDEAKMDCLISILEKYMPQVMEAGKKYIQDSWDAVACFELEIEHITGKFGTE